MNYCIYASVMGCQNSCHCCLLLNVAAHCYAMLGRPMSLGSFVRICRKNFLMQCSIDARLLCAHVPKLFGASAMKADGTSADHSVMY